MKQGRNTAGTLTITGGDTARTGRYVSQAEKAAVRAEQSAAVAEAWAVGEKGGAPVGSTDETFHNNARHFAEQAAASVTFAQAARTAAESAKDDAEAAADSVTGSAAQIQSNKQDVHDLKSAINTKAPVIINTASGAIADFTDGADDMPIKKLVVNIEPVQSGTGDPSPENVRPISGWTGATVTRAGKNLFNNIAETDTINGVVFAVNLDGTINASGTATRNAILRLGTITLPAGRYLISGLPQNGNSTTWEIMLTTGDYSAATNHIYAAGGSILSITKETTYGVQIIIRSGTTVSNMVFSPMICFASDIDSTYAKGMSTTLSITFPTEAGTVYGGTLTINADGSGDLTVNKFGFVLDGVNNKLNVASTSYIGNTTTRGYKALWAQNVIKPASAISDCAAYGNNITEQNKQIFFITGNNNLELNVRLLNSETGIVSTDTASQADTKLNAYLSEHPLTVVYESSATVTYHLANINQLFTLHGTNNIWANTGNITVEYLADTKLYIDGKIAELQATVLENIGG